MIWHLTDIYKGRQYKFNIVLGCLLSKNKEGQLKKIPLSCPAKLKKAIDIISNPFLVHHFEVDINTNLLNHKNTKWLILYAKFLIYLQKLFPSLLFFFSKFRLKVFDNSDIAIEFFRQVHPNNQKVLCLPRSIFAATTSKNFKEKGVLIIGIFHPSKHLHAWIIEDDHNPCSFDNIWTNYSPLTVIT